jgi:hypothetical protein
MVCRLFILKTLPKSLKNKPDNETSFRYDSDLDLAAVEKPIFCANHFAQDEKKTPTPLELWGLSFLLSLSSLSFFIIYLPTPNYNILNFISINILAAGILLILDSKETLGSNKNIIMGIIFAGIGGYLSFMAKPQSAALLAIIVLVYGYLEKRIPIKAVIGAYIISLTLLLITIYLTDGSLSIFYERFTTARMLEDLHGTHSVYKPFTIGISVLIGNLNHFIIFSFAFLSFLAFAIDKIEDFNKNDKSFDTTYLTLIFIIIFGAYVYLYPKFYFYNIISGYLLLAPVFTLFTASYLRFKKKNKSVEKSKILLCLLFLLFSLAFTIGSNNSIFVMTSICAFFLLLSALSMLSGVSDARNYPIRLLIIGSACLVVSMGLVYSSLKNPYRQPLDLSRNKTLINLIEDGSPLYLSEDRAGYIWDLRRAANTHGFKKGFLLIDLSGRVPGAIYALSGNLPIFSGLASIQGFSNDFFIRIFSYIPCEQMAGAWFIYDEKHLRKPIDPKVLWRSGIDIFSKEQYEAVGTSVFTSDFSKRGMYASAHYLLKPIRDHEDATEACLKALGGVN